MYYNYDAIQENYDSDCLFKFDGMSQDTGHERSIDAMIKKSLEQAEVQSQFCKQWVVMCRI